LRKIWFNRPFTPQTHFKCAKNVTNDRSHHCKATGVLGIVLRPLVHEIGGWTCFSHDFPWGKLRKMQNKWPNAPQIQLQCKKNAKFGFISSVRINWYAQNFFPTHGSQKKWIMNDFISYLSLQMKELWLQSLYWFFWDLAFWFEIPCIWLGLWKCDFFPVCPAENRAKRKKFWLGILELIHLSCAFLILCSSSADFFQTDCC
jgi:hypothetical protein